MRVKVILRDTVPLMFGCVKATESLEEKEKNLREVETDVAALSRRSQRN